MQLKTFFFRNVAFTVKSTCMIFDIVKFFYQLLNTEQLHLHPRQDHGHEFLQQLFQLGYFLLCKVLIYLLQMQVENHLHLQSLHVLVPELNINIIIIPINVRIEVMNY